MNADVAKLAGGVRDGNRRALARAITLVESTRKDHREVAIELLELLATDRPRTIRIGISGVPGVGKSTFIEAFGLHVIDSGHRVAVLSVDPSSAISGGSILGDKTRMEKLSANIAAFIRPSPSGQTLGGVARRSREAMMVCEAAGFDVVIIETVGVGQSETAVAEMTDMFLLLLLPAAGDELQGIKRGIIELADLIMVNKADGELIPAARRAAADYRLALGLMQPRSKQWRVPVELCSAVTGDGIADAWNTVEHYRAVMTASGELETRRSSQARKWMWSEMSENLIAAFKEHPKVCSRLPELEAAVMAGKLPATVAAQQLLEVFLER